MRRFRVWLGKQIVGEGLAYEVVELPDTATDDECEAACRDCLDTMIGSLLDTGWEPIGPNESADPKPKRGAR
jgi:hypothetical protein